MGCQYMSWSGVSGGHLLCIQQVRQLGLDGWCLQLEVLPFLLAQGLAGLLGLEINSEWSSPLLMSNIVEKRSPLNLIEADCSLNVRGRGEAGLGSVGRLFTASRERWVWRGASSSWGFASVQGLI